MTRCDVIVIGAGLAGLASASRLAAGGRRVVVLERAERPGGRATHDERDGFHFDAGAQLWSARDRALRELAAASPAGRELLPLRPVELAQLHDGASPRRIDPSTPLGVARMPGVGPLAALRLVRLGRIERRFADLLDPGRPERGERLDDRSVADFVRLYFGRSALERWAAPWLSDAAGCDADGTSRLLFLRLHTMRRYAELGVPRVGLGRLAEALAARLDVRLGVAVEGVETCASPGGVRVHTAAPEREVFEAAALVMATPAEVTAELAAPLLTTAELDVLRAARYAPAVVLHAALERPLLACGARLRVPAAEGLPLRAVLYETGAPGARVPEGAGSVSAIARADWSQARLEAPDDVVEKELLTVLGRLHPALPGDVRFATLRRHRLAAPLFPVGRYRQLGRLRRALLDRRRNGRRLYLAGDWLAEPTLEGAVRSGLRAAEDVAADLG